MTQSKFILFFLAFIFILKINAQDTLSHNLLWEIKHPNQKQSSYLFGTIHLIPTEDFFYPKNTLEKMSQCEKVYFEVDVEKMNDMSTMLSLMDKIMMSDGSSLQDHLEDNKYQTVKNYFEKLGLPMMFVDRIKPMFLEILANPEMNPEDLKNNKLKSYEMELATEAKTRKLKIDGLETIDFQISIFDSIPYKKQAEQLYQSIQSSNSGD
ncbi:MAG: TraB/GumN family protein [Saprospiraceae bacterium]|nr:TraB/GumN family protein [Saprospiraceae bacterium]